MPSLNERIEGEIVALGNLSREELVERWVKAYGCAPPKGVKRGLLERAAAWHLQARYLGGHSSRTRKTIRDAVKIGRPASRPSARKATREADGSAAAQLENTSCTGRVDVTSIPPRVVRPGSRLIREWNGRTHIVDVAETGYVFDGKTYRSLTAIAKRITGVHWSGPRFFGL